MPAQNFFRQKLLIKSEDDLLTSMWIIIHYLQRSLYNCKGAFQLYFARIKSKKRLKLVQFIPQRYEFPDTMTSFADGSGRIALNYFYIFFALSANSPGFVVLY